MAKPKPWESMKVRTDTNVIWKHMMAKSEPASDGHPVFCQRMSGIAKDTGIPVGRVSNVLLAMGLDGWVQIHNPAGGGHANVYGLYLDGDAHA